MIGCSTLRLVVKSDFAWTDAPVVAHRKTDRGTTVISCGHAVSRWCGKTHVGESDQKTENGKAENVVDFFK